MLRCRSQPCSRLVGLSSSKAEWQTGLPVSDAANAQPLSQWRFGQGVLGSGGWLHKRSEPRWLSTVAFGVNVLWSQAAITVTAWKTAAWPVASRLANYSIHTVNAWKNLLPESASHTGS